MLMTMKSMNPSAKKAGENEHGAQALAALRCLHTNNNH